VFQPTSRFGSRAVAAGGIRVSTLMSPGNSSNPPGRFQCPTSSAKTVMRGIVWANVSSAAISLGSKVGTSAQAGAAAGQ
jgi:hypothetical protein